MHMCDKYICNTKYIINKIKIIWKENYDLWMTGSIKQMARNLAFVSSCLQIKGMQWENINLIKYYTSKNVAIVAFPFLDSFIQF